jgi:Transcriptional regulatory protein, C terminal
LEPDPQQLITRKVHCFLEHEMGGWWVVDNGSKNPPFLRRGQEVAPVNGRTLLQEGESILILGWLSETDGPRYWELTFRDPLGTKPGGLAPMTAYLEYDWLQARLFRITDRERLEITALRLQEHKLVRYMDQRNRTSGNVAVLCTYEELLTAIWDEEHTHTETDITHLVYELRQKLEPDPRKPRFIETVQGLGYRLVTRPINEKTRI